MVDAQPEVGKRQSGHLGGFSVHVVVFALMTLMMAAGLDQVSAFSTVATRINNLGPGADGLPRNFEKRNSTTKNLSNF